MQWFKNETKQTETKEAKYFDTEKLHKNLNFSVHKSILIETEPYLLHSFTFCLILLSHYNGQVYFNSWDRDCVGCKPTIFTWPFTEKVIQPL